MFGTLEISLEESGEYLRNWSDALKKGDSSKVLDNRLHRGQAFNCPIKMLGGNRLASVARERSDGKVAFQAATLVELALETNDLSEKTNIAKKVAQLYDFLE